MNPDVAVPLAALSIPIIVVPTVLAFKLAVKSRQMSHLERMKALSLGTTVPTNNGWPVAMICVALGVFLPIVALTTAFQFWSEWAHHGMYVQTWLIGSPMILSAVGVGMAGYLAAKLLRPATSGSTSLSHHSKPHLDPDAYDVVSSRG